MNSNLLEVSGLHVSAGDKEILHGVDLTVGKDETHVLMGPNGTGKSTLGYAITGNPEYTVTAGKIVFDGEDITRLKSKAGAALRNEKIGYVFQAFNLVNEISALENVCMPLGYAGVSKRERDAVAHELLARVGMAEKANKRPVNLSGGEQQRVAIARALARSPRVLLADEPTGNLDKANSLAIMELFSSFNRSGMTIVMVTHSPDVAAYASRQIHICDGKIIESFLGGTY